MTGEPAPIEQADLPLDSAKLAALREGGRPAVLRGAASQWPAVEAGRHGAEAVLRYLVREPSQRPVKAIAAAPSEAGRFFYTDDLTRFNFVEAQGRLEAFLADLAKAADSPSPPAMAVQSEDIASLIPHVAQENALAALPGVPPRIWIGNRVRVAPHYDANENVAVCVAGQRRFTLFPPDQIANLYPGPLHLTPAGTPVSMVDIASPDLERFPRFAQAWDHALQATLQPGDAIYIPYGWWHGVDSLDPVSILVNYWWKPDVPEGIAPHTTALLAALMSIRHLPEDQRRIWGNMLRYYVFEESGDPAGHLPDHAKGVLGKASPRLFAQMRDMLLQSLQ